MGDSAAANAVQAGVRLSRHIGVYCLATAVDRIGHFVFDLAELVLEYADTLV